MERRSWLWKRKSSDRSPGETDSSGSISSHSERYSDEQLEQEGSKESPNHMQSPEVTSKMAIMNDEVHDSVKSLTNKLSAALVNVGAKEDLVKQHAKVAEEAVAGWERAENEVAVLRQQLEAAAQQNMVLEVRANHLDGALKECVRQLRQAREEQEKNIQEAVEEKTRELECARVELETQLLELQTQSETIRSLYPHVDPNIQLKLETLERENSMLRFELLTRSEDLEVRTIERDLSTQAAETASKQQLESIKKLAKLEAECRRLQALARKSPSFNDNKAISISSLCVDSLTDSQSDSGEKLNGVEIDAYKICKVEHSESEPSCSDSWASALIAELDQFKNGKVVEKNIASSTLDIDIMDDFLEMERLAALPETQNKNHCSELENVDNSLRAELGSMSHQVAELEDKLEKLEAKKVEMEKALNMSLESLAASKDELAQTQNRVLDLQKELAIVNESKELLELRLASMEAENYTLSIKADSLNADIEKESSLLAEMTGKCQDLEKELLRKSEEVEVLHNAEVKCQELEKELKRKSEEVEVLHNAEVKCQELEKELKRKSEEVEVLHNAEVKCQELEKELKRKSEEVEGLHTTTAKCLELERELTRKSEEAELLHTASSNGLIKEKQEELKEVAADRLAECQKTISSLARQLESLATLEDFLIDTANLPGISLGSSTIPRPGGDQWKLHSNDTFMPKTIPDPSRQSKEKSAPSVNGNGEKSPSSSSSSTSSRVSLNHVPTSKSKSGFGKLFSRSKSGIEVETGQG